MSDLALANVEALAGSDFDSPNLEVNVFYGRLIMRNI